MSISSPGGIVGPSAGDTAASQQSATSGGTGSLRVLLGGLPVTTLASASSPNPDRVQRLIAIRGF